MIEIISFTEINNTFESYIPVQSRSIMPVYPEVKFLMGFFFGAERF